jgi:hypothetical protein
MVVTFNSEGLVGAGSQLAGSGRSYVPAAASAPGADPTSASAVGQLNAASQALVALLNHGSVLREVGGEAVTNTATTLTTQDEDNGALIRNGGGGGGGPVAPMSVPQVPAPSVPSIPAMPAAPSPMPGEMYSQALYSGPGSAGVHQFAEQWASHGQQLAELQDRLTRTAQTIDEHWVDGQQQAGANVLRHAQWVSEMSQHAHNLATNARTVGEAFDEAKNATPSPQEFAQTRQNLQQAQQRFAATRGANAAEVQQLMQQYATQQAQATDAATGYHGQVSAATFSAGGAKTAPAIVGGGGGAAPMSKIWKQGDKRHQPVVVGPGNLGPPNTWGGEPPWLEIGPSSGNFVRSDEIPGVKVLAPGELGPATVSDAHGNPDPYIELGPNTGAWVPKSDFPGAKFYPPDSPELPPAGWQEYLPHSGIFIWHGDLIPEPYPWNGGGSPVTHPAGH